MIMGSKARLKAFNAQSRDAEALGHAVFACSSGVQERICADTLADLEGQIQALKSEDRGAELEQRSSDDLLRVMHQQRINAVGKWRDRLGAIVAKDAQAAEALRALAENNRLKLARMRDFERWEAAQKMSEGATPVALPVVSQRRTESDDAKK